MRARRPVVLTLMILLGGLASSSPTLAGGAWVPLPAQGFFKIGASRKTADTSWNSHGDSVKNGGRYENHDFRYTYFEVEVGLMKNLSLEVLLTHLYGLEGPDGDLEKNIGPSDAWVSLKYALREGSLPMALSLEVRTPYFYDIEGPYSRDLYDDEGNFLGHSPEWRGLLKHDVTLTYLVSKSRWPKRGWWNAEAGYTWREGAPADQIPVWFEYGLGVGWRESYVKLTALGVFSMGNDSPRQPNDRFGPGSGFNDASMARLGASLLTPLDRANTWTLEVGYNQWVWGRSARQYQEPYLSVGRRF